MSPFPEYEKYDATGLAELVASGEVTPLELVDAAIERIEQRNPRLNAVVTTIFEKARDQARTGNLPKGPFHGVPFLLKDLEPIMAGVPQSMGSRAFKDFLPDTDNELVKRFRASGLVILGKTNCPELGLMGVTEPELWGPARNPWKLEVTPGGSSGGSAAAVSSGMVPIASAGDGGGSIRIPAACCGLFGMKPSRGRTPLGPHMGEMWFGAVVSHVLSHSVRDSARMLDVLAGPDTGDPYLVARPNKPYAEMIGQNPGKLRIGWSAKTPMDTPLHPEYRHALEETVRLLEDLGHVVVESEPEYDGNMLLRAYLALYLGEVDATIRAMELARGKKIRRSEMEPGTWAIRLMGRKTTAGEFVFNRYQWNTVARSVGRFFLTHDVWLTPTMALPPSPIGAMVPKGIERFGIQVINALGLGGLLKASGLFEKVTSRNLARTPFTQLANLAGIPAMSVPLFQMSDGMPCGMHFSAAMGGEAVLYRLAAQLEAAKPWRNRKPTISGLIK